MKKIIITTTLIFVLGTSYAQASVWDSFKFWNWFDNNSTIQNVSDPTPTLSPKTETPINPTIIIEKPIIQKETIIRDCKEENKTIESLTAQLKEKITQIDNLLKKSPDIKVITKEVPIEKIVYQEKPVDYSISANKIVMNPEDFSVLKLDQPFIGYEMLPQNEKFNVLSVVMRSEWLSETRMQIANDHFLNIYKDFYFNVQDVLDLRNEKGLDIQKKFPFQISDWDFIYFRQAVSNQIINPDYFEIRVKGETSDKIFKIWCEPINGQTKCFKLIEK